MNPDEARKKFCALCLGDKNYKEKDVDECEGNESYSGECPLYRYRKGKKISASLIHKYCLYCMGGHSSLIEDCPSKDCPFYKFRMGTSKNTF